MTRYLCERRGRYSARVRVPRDVAHVFPKPFIEIALHTADKGEARDKLEAAVAEIKGRFARARQGGAPTPAELAYETAAKGRHYYEAALATGIGPELEYALGLEPIRDMAMGTLAKMGVEASEQNIAALIDAIGRGVNEAQARWDRRLPPPALPERPAPRQGSPEALGARLEAWLEQKRTKRGQRLVEGSQSIARVAIRRLAEKFPRVETVTKEGVETWCRQLVDTELGPATVRRQVPLWRDYWRFLKVPGVSPFDGLKLASAGDSDRERFEPPEVTALLEKATGKLRDTIMIGAYTGMRLGEIMALRVEHVDLKTGAIRIVEGKTPAAKRTIPIHSALMPLLTELASPKQTFIIEGVEAKTHKGRCDRLSKSFGALKTGLGHGEAKVFHSIRRTFVSLLVTAGVPLSTIKAIVGHRDTDITTGLYGKGGITLDVMRAAIEKLSYV